MNVSNSLAQDIVENMKDIIKQDINYIDTDATIIASTDITRIGAFHGGAKRVLSIDDDLIIKNDGEYEGSKKGINLPVYFENQIVGVIGITGEEKEVGKFGKIIQRMTEILVKEAYIQEQEKIERESKRQFIEEVLFRSHHEDERALIMRADLLDIKVNIPRVVLVARAGEGDKKELMVTPSINEKVYNSIKNYVDHNPQHLIFQSGMNIIIILDLANQSKIMKTIEIIQHSIDKKHGIKVYFGIGSKSSTVKEIKQSYEEAKKAMNVAMSFKNKRIMRYEDLDLGLLIDEIPNTTKNKFINKVFSNMKKNQIDEYTQIMETYFKNNGSITKTANELFIHKNTLQYRLNKIKALTGYDPRIINDMVVLYLAFKLNKSAT